MSGSGETSRYKKYEGSSVPLESASFGDMNGHGDMDIVRYNLQSNVGEILI